MFSAPPVVLKGPLLSGGAKEKCWLSLLLPAQKSHRVGGYDLSEHRAIGDHWGATSAACSTSDIPRAGPVKVGGAVADVLAVADESGLVAPFLFGYMSGEGYMRPDVRRNPTRRAAVLRVITTAWQTNE